MELQKNVPSTTVQDIKWSLSCTDARVKTVADTVKRLQLRMDSLEEGMSLVIRLTKEISSLKEFVMNKKKEEDTDIPCLLYQRKRRQRKLDEDEGPEKKNKEKSFLLRE